jgi:tripartite-type tricarboxylate transporter receptor subunit TctC
VFAAKLSEFWGQPVIVENRPGASTTLASRYVAQGTPDGYNMLFTLLETFTVVPHLAAHRNFQPMSELAPINLLAKLVNAIVVNPSLPVDTLHALVEYARANPTALRYGSPGRGSNIQLSLEMLKSQAKIDIQHVAYRGIAPALTAAITNEVQITQAGYSARDLIEGGKLKAIAIAGTERLQAFSKIPTTGEFGYPKVDSSSWLMMAAPAKTPKATLDTINKDLSRVLNDPEIRKQLIEARGLVITDSSGPTMLEQIGRSFQQMAEAVKVSGSDKE